MLLLAASSSTHGAQDSGETGHEHSRHHVEATFGAAFYDGKEGLFTGFEYEYRFGNRFGVGAFIDTTFSGFDLAAVGAVANYHPAGGWKIVGGLGVEQKIGYDRNKLLLRVGGAYEFHVGNGTIAPMVAYDFIEDEKDVIYAGFALGFGF
jgi:hypothetical protein